MRHHSLRLARNGQKPQNSELPEKSSVKVKPLAENPPLYQNSEKKLYHFHQILDELKESQFAGERFRQFDSRTSYPTKHEVVAHLLFLRALGALKEKIENEPSPPLYTKNVNQGNPSIEKEKKWQVYVTNALRRFVLFVKEMHHVIGSAVDETSFFAGKWKTHFTHIKQNTTVFDLLPPLDILMVWHSFMLNPTSFYDTFARLDLLPLAYLPFPLFRVAKAIDRYSFEYKPQEKQVKEFEQFLKVSFTVQLNDILGRTLKIYCPRCFEVVCETTYTNVDNTGFADPCFESKLPSSSHCKHFRLSKVTHKLLSIHQLISDLKSPLIMPNMFKNFSSVLCSNNRRNNSLSSTTFSKSEIVKKLMTNLLDISCLSRDFKLLIQLVPQENRFLTRIAIRDYASANLIHLTTKKTYKTSEILEDLVGSVTRQMRFVENMNSIDWLHSNHLSITVAEAKMRYVKFFCLMTEPSTRKVLVPTLDIDLCWHTHQLSPYNYLNCCKDSPKNRIIDHNDKYPETYLNDAFEFTQKIYKKTFKEEYSLCFCSYCTDKRIKWLKKKRTIFKKQKHIKYEAAVYQNVLTSSGLGHVSDHNVIRYSLDFEKDLELNIYPWSKYVEGEELYVNQPQNPIKKEDSCLWLKNAKTTGACGGTKSCGASGFVVSGAGVYSNCGGNLSCGSGSTAACGGAGCGTGGGGGGCGGGGGGGGGGGCGGGGGGCGGGGC